VTYILHSVLSSCKLKSPLKFMSSIRYIRPSCSHQESSRCQLELYGQGGSKDMKNTCKASKSIHQPIEMDNQSRLRVLSARYSERGLFRRNKQIISLQLGHEYLSKVSIFPLVSNRLLRGNRNPCN
jgi:hypothetical protein